MHRVAQRFMAYLGRSWGEMGIVMDLAANEKMAAEMTKHQSKADLRRSSREVIWLYSSR